MEETNLQELSSRTEESRRRSEEAKGQDRKRGF